MFIPKDVHLPLVLPDVFLWCFFIPHDVLRIELRQWPVISCENCKGHNHASSKFVESKTRLVLLDLRSLKWLLSTHQDINSLIKQI